MLFNLLYPLADDFGPFNLFDVQLTSNINGYGYVKAGTLLNLRLTLFKLDLPTLDLKAPVIQPRLGSVSDGVLTLFAGPRSADRMYIDTADAAERWVLSGTNDRVQVEFNGKAYVEFAGVTRVVVDLGQGDDVFDASALRGVPVQVSGGDGNDSILLGTLGGTAFGNAGNNSLRALATSTAAVTLVGGSGDDKLFGGMGADILVGGAGSNELQGGGGNDTLYAVLGVNKLVGGAGRDRYVFVGEIGNNTLSETGAEPSDIDFSGVVPEDILRVIGPVPVLPSVSIPPQFNAVRDQRSRLIFSRPLHRFCTASQSA